MQSIGKSPTQKRQIDHPFIFFNRTWCPLSNQSIIKISTYFESNLFHRRCFPTYVKEELQQTIHLIHVWSFRYWLIRKISHNMFSYFSSSFLLIFSLNLYIYNMICILYINDYTCFQIWIDLRGFILFFSWFSPHESIHTFARFMFVHDFSLGISMIFSFNFNSLWILSIIMFVHIEYAHVLNIDFF